MKTHHLFLTETSGDPDIAAHSATESVRKAVEAGWKYESMSCAATNTILWITIHLVREDSEETTSTRG